MKTAMILATVALTAFAHAATVAGLEQYGSLTLVDEVVCASDSTHQMREYPSGRSSSEAVLGEQCRVMRHVAKSETSNGQECGAYVAWRLGQGKGLVPKAAYLLVAEYPDNAPRSFTLGNRGTGSRTGVHTGFTVGDALNPPYITQHPEAYPLPLSGEFKRIEQVMYLMEKPESLDGNSRLASATDGFDVYFALYPAEDAPDSVGLALKSIKLYKIDDASALETAVKYPADGLPRRFVTWREEMADVGGYEAFTDPIDFYRTKAKLMKVLGFNCASRDLLEFGHCQYWDPDYNGYSNWMNYDGAKKGYWESTVDAFGAEGHYVMPYYEYTGARGGDGLGYQKLCKTLYYDTKNSEDFIESVSAAAGALVDITSPEAVAEFKKILDCTIIRFKDRAAFRGAWLRNRGSMPVSFHENTVARFNADTGRNVTRKNIADAGRSSDLYRAYMNWWYAKRAAFLEAMRDYLRQNGVADAQAYFDNDITEPGRFWEGWRNNVAYDTDYRYSGKTWAEYVGSTSWSVDSIVNTAQTWWQYGIKGEYPTYNALEHYHGCPTDDPETYQSKSGVALTLPFSAVYTQIPQAGVGSFRNADGRLLIARHYSLNEDAIFTETGAKPLGYFTSDSEHAGRASMLPQLWAMALNDPTDIGYLYGAAMETAYAPAMREFNRNFLALPAKKGTVMQGGAWGALQTVRRYDTDKGVTYWALVNTSADPVTAEFTLSSNASELSRVAASVDGTVYPVTQGKVSLTMQPMQLLALTSEIPADSPYAPSVAEPEQFDGYELCWQEEFNGTGKPDPDTWGYELGLVRNHEAQCYTRDNATVSDGRLVIEGRKERTKNPNYSAGSDSWNTRNEYADYSSSSITTSGKAHFLYGKYVFRARIPTSRGMWPCMWFLGTKWEWPASGEIDVQEFYWKGNTPTLLCNLFWSGNSHVTERSIYDLDPEWDKKYHTWVMDWDKDYIRMYVDGVLLNEQLLDSTINWSCEEDALQKSPFRIPQYILLDLPMGGDAGGMIDDSAFPTHMEVDYVRVYRKIGTTDGPQTIPVVDPVPGEGPEYETSSDAPARYDGYRLEWHDEFATDGTPISEHWNVSADSSDPSVNISCANGALVIKTSGTGASDMTAGEVNTYGKHDHMKGRVEFRARIPVEKGVRPTGWLLSRNRDYPAGGMYEILDSLYLGGAPAVAMWSTWAADEDWYSKGIFDYIEKDPKWAAKFHVWRLDWDDSAMKIYLDGELFHSKSTSDMKNNGECPFISDGNQFYLGFSLGLVNADVTAATAGMKYEIDWVRYYVPGEEPDDPDPGVDPDPDEPPSPSASEFTWTFPETGAAPTAEICTFLYGKTWAYTFEMDDNPLGAYTIAKPLFDRLTATDAPSGVQGGVVYSMPGTLGIIANTIDNMKPSVNITVEQMKELIAAGWSISNHGYWHTGIHWDPEKANDEAMYRREFFWGQFFISHYIWDGQRSCTAMVFPNGDTGYGPYLEQYGILVGTVCASTPHNVLRSGTNGSKVNFLNCGRSNLDEGNWRDHSDLDPLWLLPENFEEGDWFIDFTHGISEPGKGTYAAASNRLEYIRTKWGAGGADNVWLATTDRVAQYRKAAEAATISVTGGKVTVSLPETVIQSALTLKISGIPASAQLTAPEGGRLYRNAAGDVFLTTPVIGEKITNHPAGNLVKAHEAEIKVGAGSIVAQEITFNEPVLFAGMRLQQFGDLPDGFDINLRLVTSNGEVPFNFAKYNKYVNLGNAWGTWRLFPQLPDEEALPIIGIRYNAAQAFKKVEIWAVGDEGSDEPGDDPDEPDDPPTPPAEQPDKTMQAWFSRTVSPEQIVGGAWRTPEGDELVFAPTAASRERDAVYVDVEATFPQVAASALPSAARGQAAVSAADGALYVHGSAGWTRLANATVSQGVAKSLRVEFDYSSQSAPRVRVWEHGTDSYTELKDADGNSWFACSGSKNFLTSLAFGGDGTIGDFAGYCENGPREIGTIEVPSFVGPDGVTRGGVGMKDVGGNAVFAVTIANAQKGAYYTAFTCMTLSSSAADWVAEKTSSPAPLDGLLELDVEASDAPSKFVKIIATPVSIGAGTRLSDIE
jgi:beta-glucanase (GH16 family)